MINNVILYTWQDVERYLYMNKTSWPKEWNNIDVYSDEIVIYSNDVGNYLEKESKEFLSSMFKGNYKDNKIVIAKTKVEMSIIYEQDEMEEQAKNPYPLFKDFHMLTRSILECLGNCLVLMSWHFIRLKVAWEEHYL